MMGDMDTTHAVTTPRYRSRFLPWADESVGGTRRGWTPAALVRRAPAVVAYLLVSVVLFVPTARRVPGNVSIDIERLDRFLYHIPDLSENFPLALRSLLTGPFLNHNLVQLVYVVLLLVLFAVPFESHEGARRTTFIFFATSFVAAIVGGAVLHLIYPEVLDNAFLEKAWERTWSGGSAGCFGLMGALAARARTPWPLLGAFAAWEVTVVVAYLREWTPAFHLTALLTGFALARWVVRPRSQVDAGR